MVGTDVTGGTVQQPTMWLGRKATLPAVVLVMCVCAVFSVLNRHYTLDDALIYYRYVQHAIDGHGLVYNVGEYVNGLTSPLYTYLSVLAAFVVRDVARSQWALASTLFCSAAVAVMFIRPATNGLTPGAVFAGLGIATSRYFYSVAGLETPLLLLLLAVTLGLFLRGQTGWWMASGALLLLTRGESVFFLTVLTAAHLMMRRPFPRWQAFLFPVIILTAHYAFNWLYFGSPLPATLMAKIQQGDSGLWETGRWGRHLIFLSVGYHFDRYFASNVVLLAFPVLLAGGGLLTGRRDTLVWMVVSFLLLYTGFYVALSIPNYHWYYAPYYFFAFVLAGGFVDAVHDAMSRRWRGRSLSMGLLAALTLTAGLVAWQGAFCVRDLPKAGGYGSYTDIALWIKGHTPSDAKVASAEIGHIGWFSERYIIDILGLVSPPNAELIGRRDLSGWLRYYAPDYIVVHDPSWRHEASADSLRACGAFTPVPEFDFPGYGLLQRRGMTTGPGSEAHP